MTPAKILIIEDKNIVGKDIQNRLTNLGYTVTGIVSSGVEAIKKTAEMQPDLVLMDIVLKGDMNGIEAAEHIRTRFNTAVVYLTAYSDDETLTRAKITGPFGYILKPFETKELQIAIEMALYKKKMENKLIESEKWLSTILGSMGDALIATDEHGHIKFMNDVAEKLTGWKNKDASEKDLIQVFRIKNEQTGQEIENPVSRFLKEGDIVGLGDHTILLTKNIKEIPIADSAAPIMDDNGKITGVVLVFRDITEQKNAEESLRESEEKYRNMIETTHDVVLMGDIHGNFTYINPQAEKITGYKISDWLGKSFFSLIQEEDITEITEIFHQVCQGQSKTYEVKIPDITGKMLTFSVNTVPSYKEGTISGSITFGRDITERKKSEETLVKLNKAIQTSGEIVFLTNLEGIISYINPAFTATYGYPADDVVGKVTPRILKSGLMKSEDHEMLWKMLLSGQVPRGEYKNRTKDGRLIDIEGSASPVYDDKNNIIGFLGIQRDITERKRIDKELVRAKEKAEESEKLISAFLANMSHEIRTPMNGILGFAELLKEPGLSEEDLDKFIGIINRNSQQLMHIISDIVDISKIEAGQENVNLTLFDLNEMLDDIFSTFHPQALLKQLKLILRKEIPGGVFFIRSDAVKVKQILINLVGNAIKFTDEGGVGVECSLEADKLIFRIKDTGNGIKKELQEVIFDRFRQADLSTTRKYGGTGLGLSISRSYVEMLGGKIWLESTSGQGSVFIFDIPFVPAGAISAEKEQVKSISSSLSQSLSGKTILIVEDEEDNAFFIREAVRTIGLVMIFVTNGIEAIEQCKNHPEISLALMDIKMQNMDGFETTKIIKSFREDLPVIATTAYALSGDKEKCLAAGCDDYLPKPIFRESLINMIIKYLG